MVNGFHNWLKLQLCFLIGGNHWVRKKVNIWLHKKGGGLERHPPLYLKYRAKCWSILEYLFLNWSKGKTKKRMGEKLFLFSYTPLTLTQKKGKGIKREREHLQSYSDVFLLIYWFFFGYFSKMKSVNLR